MSATRHIGIASGINNAVADIASLVAVAVFGEVGLSVFGHMLDGKSFTPGTSPELTKAIAAIKQSLAGTYLSVTLPADARAALQASISTSFAVSFRLLMLSAAALAALSAACTALTISREAISSPR
jgi:hypothetical protein